MPLADSALYAVQCVCRQDGCTHSAYCATSANDHFDLYDREIDHVAEGGMSFSQAVPEDHHLLVPDSGFLDANGLDMHPARGVPMEFQRAIIVERHPDDDEGDDTRARDLAIAAGMAADSKLCPNYDDGYTVEDVLDEFENAGWESWRNLMPFDHGNNRRHLVHLLFRPREERAQAAENWAALRQRHRRTLSVSVYILYTVTVAHVCLTLPLSIVCQCVPKLP